MQPKVYKIAFIAIFLIPLYLKAQFVTQVETISSVYNKDSYGDTQGPTNLKPLKVGDYVPQIWFKKLENPLDTVSLSSFDNKLILLDFWSTWCSGCYEMFPKLDSLQETYKDRLKIILVNSVNTGDTRKKSIDFFKKRFSIDHRKYSLSVAVEDDMADFLFPHEGLPHYVWISKDRRVLAITGSEEVTWKNVKNAIIEQPENLTLKKDFLSQEINLTENERILNGNYLHYTIFRKGKLEDTSVIVKTRKLLRFGRDGYIIQNMSLRDIYREIAHYLGVKKKIDFTNVRIVLEVQDPSKVVFNPEKYKRENWEKENLYTLDAVVPESHSDNLINYMLEDVNRYSGYYGRFEERVMNCLALVEIGSTKQIMSKNQGPKLIYENDKEVEIANLPIGEFRNFLETKEIGSMPIVNQTTTITNIDLKIRNNFKGIDEVKKLLREYNLDLIPTHSKVVVFVIYDRKPLE